MMSLLEKVSVKIPGHSRWGTGVNNTGQLQLAGILMPGFDDGIVFYLRRMVHRQVDLNIL